MSLFFWQERLYADSAYYTFRVINEGKFWVEHHRYILGFSQFFTLIAVKLHFPLKTILVLTSVGHVVFFYGIYLWCRYGLQNPTAGILLLMIQVLGIAQGFFVPMFELYYAAALIVLFFSILRKKETPGYIVLSSVLLVIIATAHFNAMLLFVFFLALHFIENNYQFRWYYVVFGSVLVGTFLVKSQFQSHYEMAKTQSFLNNLSIRHFSGKALTSWGVFLMKNYSFPLAIFAWIVYVMLQKKKIVLAWVYMIGVLSFLAMAHISHPELIHTRYQEQVYFAFCFAVGWAAVLIWPHIKSTTKNTFIFAIFSVGIVSILWASKTFVGRTKEMNSLVERSLENPAQSKWVVNQNQLMYETNWSYPIETMLYSSAIKKKTITICTLEDVEYNENGKKLVDDNYLFRKWELYDQKSLNREYFELSQQPYKPISLPNK
ncbi:MAG: hypothetical protein H6607_02420 [Flavobacteriales bacterium]|nr:hypothetical protein [Flavobacteriales bacterium]